MVHVVSVPLPPRWNVGVRRSFASLLTGDLPVTSMRLGPHKNPKTGRLCDGGNTLFGEQSIYL